DGRNRQSLYRAVALYRVSQVGRFQLRSRLRQSAVAPWSALAIPASRTTSSQSSGTRSSNASGRFRSTRSSIRLADLRLAFEATTPPFGAAFSFGILILVAYRTSRASG